MMHTDSSATPPAEPQATAAERAAREDVERLAAERHNALSGFARKMAHDLNNFATVIRTYSELVLSDVPITSPTHADVDEVHRAANAMVAYVQRISRFARASNIRLTALPLRPLINSALAASSSNGVEPVRLQVDEQVQALFVRTDATWCTDVVRELLLNARAASPDGAPILLSAHCRSIPTDTLFGSAIVSTGEWAVIAITDDGAGFLSTINEFAEDPFVSTKDGVRGAGFGLTLAVVLARAQHGCLTRERVNNQTVVSLWFPLDSQA